MPNPTRPLMHSLADTRQQERLAEAADVRRAALCQPTAGRRDRRPAALASVVARCRATVHRGARISLLALNRLASVGRSQ